MRLTDKVSIITGAGQGIGRATATAFAREGARVIATDVNEAALAGLKDVGVAESHKLDARDTAAVEAIAKRVGPIDILFNAAGFVHHGTVLDCSEQDWDFSFDLNVKSMHRTIRAFLPGMLSKGKGDFRCNSAKTRCGVLEASTAKSAPARASLPNSSTRYATSRSRSFAPTSASSRFKSMLLSRIGG